MRRTIALLYAEPRGCPSAAEIINSKEFNLGGEQLNSGCEFAILLLFLVVEGLNFELDS